MSWTASIGPALREVVRDGASAWEYARLSSGRGKETLTWGAWTAVWAFEVPSHQDTPEETESGMRRFERIAVLIPDDVTPLSVGDKLRRAGTDVEWAVESRQSGGIHAGHFQYQLFREVALKSGPSRRTA